MSEALRFDVEGLALRAGGRERGRLLFENLRFGVRAGERWVVLGPNGAGKSSLLAAMAGVFPSDAGRVLLQGCPLAQWRPEALADWRAWCPQFWLDPFPATVAETAAIARRRGAWWRTNGDDDAEIDRVLAELDLAVLSQADVRELSGGERQRVAVATALLQGAPLVLLDEPASHLDLAHQQLLRGVLMRWSARDGAAVASMHDINLAWDMATHAVLLDGRGAAVAGSREEVMTPALLSSAFDVAVDRVEVCGQTRFWVGQKEPVP
ncbi:ABC transporter ATP-binding protein [Piscinibacter sp. XHJ-5]|uniref:ABC transporter ATP-binding protein n=1 Tax=Piscinibacter sp. XHJ-5 TaxID=3037797 RepID=UPI002453542C|nr:ABC transporter ATP-binding protein [Piscinibacter sp. XHJ-5]